MPFGISKRGMKSAEYMSLIDKITKRVNRYLESNNIPFRIDTIVPKEGEITEQTMSTALRLINKREYVYVGSFGDIEDCLEIIVESYKSVNASTGRQVKELIDNMTRDITSEYAQTKQAELKRPKAKKNIGFGYSGPGSGFGYGRSGSGFGFYNKY